MRSDFIDGLNTIDFTCSYGGKQVHCIWNIKRVQLRKTSCSFYSPLAVNVVRLLMQKGQCLLSKNVQPSINLEITVPHITLPLSKQHWQKGGDRDQQSTTEQVHIVSHALQAGADAGQHDEHVIEVPVAKIQKERFHIFQVPALIRLTNDATRLLLSSQVRRKEKDVAAQGHTFLLQILRGRREQMRPSDELAFTIEFQGTQDSPEIAQVEDTYPAGLSHISPKAIAGLSTIVIFLDEKGKPGGYSIDGAEG